MKLSKREILLLLLLAFLLLFVVGVQWILLPTYQQYQGDKLCRRFDAYSYYRLTQAFDSHNVGRYRGGVESALSTIRCPAMIVGISSDMLFPVSEQVFLYRHIPNSRLRLIDSPFGHDGFLVEYDKLNAILKPFVNGSI